MLINVVRPEFLSKFVTIEVTTKIKPSCDSSDEGPCSDVVKALGDRVAVDKVNFSEER